VSIAANRYLPDSRGRIPLWSILAWRKLADPEIELEIESLRADTLRLFIECSGAFYLLWHFTTLLVRSDDVDPASSVPYYWTLLGIVAPGLLLSWRLQRRRSSAAAACYLATGFLAATTAIWLFGSPAPALAYPLLALVAVVLLHPLAGATIGVASVTVLAALEAAGPLGFLETDDLVAAGLASAVAVLAASALGHNLVVAVAWALNSSDQAVRNMEEARQQRGELLRAVKQLDIAYYRIERANAALDVAWRTAEAAERSRSEFVTNISHELRTPLNLVVGFSEMILTSQESYGAPLPAPYRADLNAIYRSAQHLLNLTNDVIDLARVGAGRLALAREPIELGRVISDACDIIREYVEAKSLSLRLDVRPDLPIVTVDRLRIRQVLLNLLTNAARFTEQGSITVSARCDDRSAIVEVTDTGAGIPPDELSRIFEEFHHGSPEARERADALGGVGLGLPISRRFVELHGGEMGVESRLGSGTTFWFTLPLEAVEGVAHEAWRPASPSGGRGAAEQVVVLAGSDADFGRWVQRHARDSRVVLAPDLRRAHATAREVRAAAIITDCGAARNEEDRPAGGGTVPVIRVPLPNRDRVAAALGAAAYLIKPITRSLLRETVARLNRSIRSVLIVDDDARFVQLVARQLRSSADGYEILTARNGLEALRVMATTTPDLVLLDLAMPELAGRDVLRAMAADPRLAAVPAIVISAMDELDAGAVLTGPISIDKSEGFHLEELLDVVESIIRTLEPPRVFLGSPPARP
jgi:signal transduction histidine kinase/CheY-like chemotaxis protein